jgi:PAS domain S-box-containing protein
MDEAALAECEALLSQIQTLALIGYWRLESKSGGIVFISKELQQIHGLPPEQEIEKFSDAYALVHPDDRAALKEFDGMIQAAPRDAEFEYRVVDPDGKVRFLHETVAAELDDTGVAIGLLGIVQDVSAGKRAEEQLMLAHRMEAVGQLTGGIAHDFNNLLGIILGNLDLIEMGGGNPSRTGSQIDAIRRAADRGASLTHSLLAFARRQFVKPPFYVPLPDRVSGTCCW